MLAAGAAWLLAVAVVPVAIMAVPVVPVVPIAMPVVRARPVASMTLARAASTVAMAAVPSHNIHAQIETVAAVMIRPRVCMAVMARTWRTTDALYPLVGLLGRLAVVWSVGCS